MSLLLLSLWHIAHFHSQFYSLHSLWNILWIHNMQSTFMFWNDFYEPRSFMKFWQNFNQCIQSFCVALENILFFTIYYNLTWVVINYHFCLLPKAWIRQLIFSLELFQFFINSLNMLTVNYTVRVLLIVKGHAMTFCCYMYHLIWIIISSIFISHQYSYHIFIFLYTLTSINYLSLNRSRYLVAFPWYPFIYWMR